MSAGNWKRKSKPPGRPAKVKKNRTETWRKGRGEMTIRERKKRTLHVGTSAREDVTAGISASTAMTSKQTTTKEEEKEEEIEAGRLEEIEAGRLKEEGAGIGETVEESEKGEKAAEERN